MESAMTYAIIAAIVVVVTILLVAVLVVPRRRAQRGGLAAARPAKAGTPGGSAGAGTAVIDRSVTEVAPEVSGTTVDLSPVLERPEALTGRLQRLRARLAGNNTAFGRSLLALLSRSSVDSGTWERIEEALLGADLGVGPTAELLQALETDVKVLGTSDPAVVRAMVRSRLLALVDPDLPRELLVDPDPRTEIPAVVMIVGVNGTGKTTTAGKLARLLVAEDRDVVLGAADTFRAAAAEQLETWGARVGVPVVRGEAGADPAAVAFDAVAVGIRDGADAVLIDTAGRLHTKVGLMDELGKVRRVIEKQAPVTEALLVLDATTGQNGLAQARVFAEVVAITGVVLTKLDGTAKGGIVVAVQRELGVPVKLVGVGEGPDDLAPFDPEIFVDALLGSAA